MSIVLLLVLLGVIAAIAVVAGGRGGSLADAPPDRSPRGVLPSGPVDRTAVDGLRFSLAFRGYRMTEVDWLLDQLAQTLDERDAEIAALRARAGTDLPDPGTREHTPEPPTEPTPGPTTGSHAAAGHDDEERTDA